VSVSPVGLHINTGRSKREEEKKRREMEKRERGREREREQERERQLTAPFAAASLCQSLRWVCALTRGGSNTGCILGPAFDTHPKALSQN